MCLTTGITLTPWKLLMSECQSLISFKRGVWSPKVPKEWLPKIFITNIYNEIFKQSIIIVKNLISTYTMINFNLYKKCILKINCAINKKRNINVQTCFSQIKTFQVVMVYRDFP